MIYSLTAAAPALTFGRAERRTPAVVVDRPVDAGTTLLELYDAYASHVYKFIYNKVQSREDAEDLTSQVFLKAVQTLDTIRHEKSMLAWLYQVARTTIADHWRSHYRSGTLSIEELTEEQGLQCVAQEPTENTSSDSMAQAQVAAVLATLPEKYRMVLEYRFLQGYSLKETAAVMNTTEGNIKVLQYRAMQRAAKLDLDLVLS